MLSSPVITRISNYKAVLGPHFDESGTDKIKDKQSEMDLNDLANAMELDKTRYERKNCFHLLSCYVHTF